MSTVEVRCAKCGEKKWPTLPERPEHYICVLCRAVTSEQREKRLETGRRSAVARRTRLGAAGDST